LSKNVNKARGGRADGLTDTADGLAASPLAPPPRLQSPAGSISRIILRDWKRIAAITVLAASIAWLLAALQPPRYRASALASVAPTPDALQPNELLRGVEVLAQRTVVATIAALASTPATRGEVAAATGYDIEATVLPNTNLVRVDVEGGDAAQTAAIANRIPAVLSTQTRAMYKYYAVTMVSPAARPDAPFLPRTGRGVAAGVLIGLFLGLMTAWFTQRQAIRSVA
jgi:capsular polysaccharide biosynthesis protein